MKKNSKKAQQQLAQLGKRTAQSKKSKQAATPGAGFSPPAPLRNPANPYAKSAPKRKGVPGTKPDYPFPIPSRIDLAAAIAHAPEGVSLDGLIRLFKLKPHEAEATARRVAAMEREDEVRLNHRGNFVVPGKAKVAEEPRQGRVSSHPEGYGFLTPTGSTVRTDDVFLNNREMQKCLHGDTVRFEITGVDRRGRTEGRVVEVLERGLKRVVGKLQKDGRDWRVIPEDRRLQLTLVLDYASIKAQKALHHDLNEGTIVEAVIDIYPTANSEARGHIIDVLGGKDDAGIEIEVALRKHDLPHRFSPAVETEAAALPDIVKKTDITKELKAGRRDVRDLPLVTIDGKDARDFDDAVYAEPIKGTKGFRLVVAIADVSHYVKVGQPLDDEARNRSTSVYFPRRVIPMLPEKLSNGLCSLNPAVDRMVMVCDMQVGATGVVKAYEFYPGVMHSKARFTYTEVAAILADPKSAAPARKELVPHLQTLHKVFKALLTARTKRGAIEFETTETYMLFNEHGKIDRIVPRTRNDAHRLIEECMLAANVCAAQYLLKAEHPALYRVHAGPTEFKLDKLREYLGPLGLSLGGGEKPTTKDYAKLALQVKERPDAALIQMVMLRSMQQAIYTPDNDGHFGLAYEAYAHFTSPIRRYPDLLVHRAIKAVLKGRKYQEPDWGGLGVNCSANERRADEASREVEQYLKCFFMQDKVGEVFEGTIASVVHFGLFVVLDAFYIEGLVHIRDLGRDYFTHDDAQHQLRGEKTGVSYGLGQRVRVKVASVNMETSKIDFTIAETLEKPLKRPVQSHSSSIASAPKEPDSVVKRMRRSW